MVNEKQAQIHINEKHKNIPVQAFIQIQKGKKLQYIWLQHVKQAKNGLKCNVRCTV